MELEKELVRALRPLALGSVPESAIALLFDTGGTASVHDEWSTRVTRRQLRTVDKVFTKYLQRPVADAHVAHFWRFLASQEAIDAVIPSQDDSENHDAVYRSFFALLQAVVNVRDVYAQYTESEKRSAVVKALMAAKVYLAWLQLPGGSAYGLFMAYVYRQVLDTLKKWVLLLAPQDSGQSGTKSNQAGRPNRRRCAQRLQESDDESDVNSGKGRQLLTAAGLDLLDMVVRFLKTFSLSASHDSIVSTIETIIALQTAVVDETDGIASNMTVKTRHMVEALVSGAHGEPVAIARVLLHCYLPGVTFQETSVKENRAALRFHKLAMDVVSEIQQLVAKKCEADDAEGTAHREQSLMVLGLIQNVCLQAPGLADERQRVLSFVVAMAVAGRRECELMGNLRYRTFRDEEWVRFARFLASYSRNPKLKYRQFAVELISRIAVETRLWTVNESEVSEVLVPYAGVGPLLEILIERACDKMSQVRTKAIGGLSALLTLGLSNLADNEEVGEDEQMNGSETIASSLQKLLYESSVDEKGVKQVEKSPLMQRLVDLLRERLLDEKSFVRKATVHALEALMTAHSSNTVHASSKKDLFDIQARCTDASVIVRVQSIKSLTAIVLKFPFDDEAQKLWNLGVFPLCIDPETSVQACALEAAGSVVFDRVLAWYDARQNESMRDSLDCVWMQVSHLDGVMARCLQKALRMLIKSNKVSVKKLIQACVFAIQQSVSPYNSGDAVHEETEDDTTRRLLTRSWGFSWIVLEELAHSGHLVETVKGHQQHLRIVVECWNKLQDQVLPMAFNDGSKRILRVIAAISTVIDAHDAKSIADGILASLHSFAIPLNVISDGVLALHSICKAKAPSFEKSREINLAWGSKLLDLCEVNLRNCFESTIDSMEEETVMLQKQLISIGEVALLEFDKDADKSSEAALVPVSSSLKSLVQLFLPPKFVPNSMAMSQIDEDESRAVHSEPIALPTPVRVCAFVTLGKLCLRDDDLAKQCMTMLIRELRTCAEQEIRSNILLILGDLCIRYTSLVDAYVPTIALSLLDKSRLLRRNTLLLFSQLILQDYIKWRESLLRFFLRAAVDEDEELANLARHVLCGPLLQKSPHIFTSKFIEMLFVLNGVEGDKIKFAEPFEEQGIRELALPGTASYPRRAQLYTFLLDHMSDEQKLQISMKLCNEVLEEVMDGTLPLCENPSQITDRCTEAVLKDTFAILCSREIKLTSSKGEDEDGEGDDLIGGESAHVASQLAAAKGKLLSKLSKKNFLENVVPVLIGLKHTLEAKHSPLTRDLLHYIRELFKLYRQEVKDIFTSTDPQMAMEVEYDLRQLDLHQQPAHRTTCPLDPVDATVESPPSANKTSCVPPPPQEDSMEATHAPLRLRNEKKATRRRRKNQPGAPNGGAEVASEEMVPFSPNQSRSGSENRHVPAKSPLIDKEGAGVFELTSDGEENVPPSVNTSRRRVKVKRRMKATRRGHQESQSDENVPLLPLKKKAKKSSKMKKKKR